MEKHTDALSTLVDAKWVDALEPSHEDAETMGEAATGEQEEAGGSDGSSGGGGGGGDANEGSAEPALSFAHLAHQFKTMCFSYSLLQASSISLNIYNMYFFFPGKTNWLVVLACIVTQVAAPFFLLLHQLEFMRDLWPAEERDTDPWATWDVITVAVVILLFDTINAEIFSKQIRNSLLTLRLRNVVWNSSRDWKVSWVWAGGVGHGSEVRGRIRLRTHLTRRLPVAGHADDGFRHLRQRDQPLHHGRSHQPRALWEQLRRAGLHPQRARAQLHHRSGRVRAQGRPGRRAPGAPGGAAHQDCGFPAG